MVQELIEALKREGIERGRLRFIGPSFAISGDEKYLETLATRLGKLSAVENYFDEPTIKEKYRGKLDLVYDIKEEFQKTEESQAAARDVMQELQRAFPKPKPWH